MDIILALLFAMGVIASLLYFFVRKLEKMTLKNKELTRKNKQQQQELNNVKQRQKITRRVNRVSDDELDKRLQSDYRD